MPSPSYYEKNKEKIKEQVRLYQEANRQRKYEWNRKWRETHPEKFRAIQSELQRKRRARKKQEQEKQNECDK